MYIHFIRLAFLIFFAITAAFSVLFHLPGNLFDDTIIWSSCFIIMLFCTCYIPVYDSISLRGTAKLYFSLQQNKSCLVRMLVHEGKSSTLSFPFTAWMHETRLCRARELLSSCGKPFCRPKVTKRYACCSFQQGRLWAFETRLKHLSLNIFLFIVFSDICIIDVVDYTYCIWKWTMKCQIVLVWIHSTTKVIAILLLYFRSNHEPRLGHRLWAYALKWYCSHTYFMAIRR